MLLFPQSPSAAPPASTTIATATDLLHQAPAFGWVDQLALAVLLVFFVIGLFKGLIWQVSRIAILVVAYVAAGRYGQEVGAWLTGPRTTTVTGVDAPAVAGLASDTPDTTLYLAYLLIFLGVLIVLSLLAMLLQRLASKAGLGFFDRLGGGVFGVVTGAFVVLFALFLLNMFAPDGKLAEAAQRSHSLRLSQTAIDWLGDHVDDDLRRVLNLSPMSTPPTTPPSVPPVTAPGEATEHPIPSPTGPGKPANRENK